MSASTATPALPPQLPAAPSLPSRCFIGQLPLELLAQIFNQNYEEIGFYAGGDSEVETVRQVRLGGVNQLWRDLSLRQGAYQCLGFESPTYGDRMTSERLSALLAIDPRRAREARALKVRIGRGGVDLNVAMPPFLLQFEQLQHVVFMPYANLDGSPNSVSEVVAGALGRISTLNRFELRSADIDIDRFIRMLAKWSNLSSLAISNLRIESGASGDEWSPSAGHISSIPRTLSRLEMLAGSPDETLPFVATILEHAPLTSVDLHIGHIEPDSQSRHRLDAALLSLAPSLLEYHFTDLARSSTQIPDPLYPFLKQCRTLRICRATGQDLPTIKQLPALTTLKIRAGLMSSELESFIIARKGTLRVVKACEFDPTDRRWLLDVCEKVGGVVARFSR